MTDVTLASYGAAKAPHNDAVQSRLLASASFPHFSHYQEPSTPENPTLGYEKYREACSQHREMRPRISLSEAQSLALISTLSHYANGIATVGFTSKLVPPVLISQNSRLISVKFKDGTLAEFEPIDAQETGDELLSTRRLASSDPVETSSMLLIDKVELTIAQYRALLAIKAQDATRIELPLLQGVALQAAIEIRRSIADVIDPKIPIFVDADKTPAYFSKRGDIPSFYTYVAFSDGVVAHLTFVDIDRNEQRWILSNSTLLSLRGQPLDAWNHRNARELMKSGRFACDVRFPDGSFPEGV